MKKAFTIIELIFVLVVGAILTTVAISKLNPRSNDLDLAADQLMTHLRYTQHLAVMDDRYNSNKGTNVWYKTRWQVYFQGITEKQEMQYTVFKDIFSGGNPNSIHEVARNPLDPNLLLACDLSGYPKEGTNPTAGLCLQNEYGIVDIKLDKFNPSSGNPPTRIAFDELGRPIIGSQNSQNSAYQKIRQLSARAKITLVHSSGESASICIEPETGYIHRCD